MAELIDRADLLAEIQLAIEDSGCVNHERDMLDCIRYAPTIDAVQVVHARWEFADDQYCRCTGCHQKAPVVLQYQDEPETIATDYCPHCGARMDADAPERGGEDLHV